MNPEEQIKRIAQRFEIAVSNFGRSCIDMQANEKAFQAWYASCVIQEFGVSHVYREIHLWKSELFALAPANELTKHLEKGHELFPDLSLSWFPNVDARHSSTRESKLREAGALLSEFAVVSELKVTGSTLSPTPAKGILTDLGKLFVFSEAHKVFSRKNGRNQPLKCYMVILDNAKDKEGGFKKCYPRKKLERIVENAEKCWNGSTPKPSIIHIAPGRYTARVSMLNEFSEWIEVV
jgi:hypothetical protein